MGYQHAALGAIFMSGLKIYSDEEQKRMMQILADFASTGTVFQKRKEEEKKDLN